MTTPIPPITIDEAQAKRLAFTLIAAYAERNFTEAREIDRQLQADAQSRADTLTVLQLTAKDIVAKVGAPEAGPGGQDATTPILSMISEVLATEHELAILPILEAIGQGEDLRGTGTPADDRLKCHVTAAGLVMICEPEVRSFATGMRHMANTATAAAQREL